MIVPVGAQRIEFTRALFARRIVFPLLCEIELSLLGIRFRTSPGCRSVCTPRGTDEFGARPSKGPHFMSRMGGGGEAGDRRDPSVHTTLLVRLRDRDEQAWRDFDFLYGPLIESWCAGAGVTEDVIHDIRQEVFRAVAQHIASFRRDRTGDTFRGWLWQITRNKIRDHWRLERRRPQAQGGTEFHQRLLHLPDVLLSSLPPTSVAEERGIIHRALQLVRSEVAARTFEAFRLVVIEEVPAPDVAKRLGMTTGAVYVAKSRLLKRIRQLLGELWEEGP